MRRQDITFEDKDQALRHDVRTLGALVGDLLRDQGGDELFEFVDRPEIYFQEHFDTNGIAGI